LGWSHGDDEIFSREQFLQWFNLDHLGKSAAQFDEAKMRWVNAQHLKAMPDEKLAEIVAPFLGDAVSVALDTPRRVAACALLKDRCSTLIELAEWMQVLVSDAPVSAEEIQAHVPADVFPAVARLAGLLAEVEWSKPAIAAVIKQVLGETGLKMPQLAMPVRVLVAGRPQTPSLDALLSLMDRANVISRLGRLKGA
ncbi:MAG: glutamate--tRNA ligase, partial [Polaromonas sp.]|nr:glutamate--tRNA ligase [Polaromonas sp.]